MFETIDKAIVNNFGTGFIQLPHLKLNGFGKKMSHLEQMLAKCSKGIRSELMQTTFHYLQHEHNHTSGSKVRIQVIIIPP